MNVSDFRIALVVPTIRENCFRDFCTRWGKLGLFNKVRLIVMEDNPERTFDAEKVIEEYSHFKATHLCWQDIERTLGLESWIIPRRSDTVRSFAYYYAWAHGYDYIMTMDDDCYPPTHEGGDGLTYEDGETFIYQHLKQLTGRTRWFNTLNRVKPRGIPFYNVGKSESVVVNHGLWTNVLDYDAPYQLANPVPEKFSYDNRIVPAGLYFPMCGMNVMWRADATVLMYHLLMGQWARVIYENGVYKEININGLVQPILERLPFDRFGDIWCGIIMKKITDIKGLLVTTGMPYIRHERASNPFVNLKKEANGIEVNEKFWEHVDKFDLANVHSLPDLYHEMGRHVSGYTEFKEHSFYFKVLGDAMMVWSTLFRADHKLAQDF